MGKKKRGWHFTRRWQRWEQSGPGSQPPRDHFTSACLFLHQFPCSFFSSKASFTAFALVFKWEKKSSTWAISCLTQMKIHCPSYSFFMLTGWPSSWRDENRLSQNWSPESKQGRSRPSQRSTRQPKWNLQRKIMTTTATKRQLQLLFNDENVSDPRKTAGRGYNNNIKT